MAESQVIEVGSLEETSPAAILATSLAIGYYGCLTLYGLQQSHKLYLTGGALAGGDTPIQDVLKAALALETGRYELSGELPDSFSMHEPWRAMQTAALSILGKEQLRLLAQRLRGVRVDQVISPLQPWVRGIPEAAQTLAQVCGREFGNVVGDKPRMRNLVNLVLLREIGLVKWSAEACGVGHRPLLWRGALPANEPLAALPPPAQVIAPAALIVAHDGEGAQTLETVPAPEPVLLAETPQQASPDVTNPTEPSEDATEGNDFEVALDSTETAASGEPPVLGEAEPSGENSMAEPIEVADAAAAADVAATVEVPAPAAMPAVAVETDAVMPPCANVTSMDPEMADDAAANSAEPTEEAAPTSSDLMTNTPAATGTPETEAPTIDIEVDVEVEPREAVAKGAEPSKTEVEPTSQAADAGVLLDGSALKEGVTFLRQGSLAAARYRLEDYLRFFPDDTEAAAYMAWVDVQDDLRDEASRRAALAAFDLALARKRNADILTFKGSVLRIESKFNESLLSFEEALRIDPRHASARYELEQVRLRMHTAEWPEVNVEDVRVDAAIIIQRRIGSQVRIHSFKQPEIRIGSGDNDDVVVSSAVLPQVARRHCTVIVRDKRIWVRRNASFGRVFVNGKEIDIRKDVAVSSADCVRLGEGAPSFEFKAFGVSYLHDMSVLATGGIR